MGWFSDFFDNVFDFVEDVVNTVVDFVGDVFDFVGDIIGFVIAPFGAFDTPQAPDPGEAARGVTVTKTGTNVAVPVVYGYRRVGGSIVFAESNGESNKYLYIVYAIAEGEIQGVRKLIVNDVDLPVRGTFHTHGTVYTVNSGRFKDRMQYQIFNGRESQAQSTLANQTPTWPKKRRRLPGIAYCVCRFEWKEVKTQEDADANPYSGGIPQVQFDVYGKKVYDVRTHGSGKELSGSYTSRSKGYSFNPANCLLDYLENTRYGAGIDKSQIDAEAFKIAANKYEQTVQYSNKQTGRAMTMNAVIDTKQKVLDNVKALVAGSRSMLPFVQGRYKLKVEDGGDPIDITSSTVTVAYDVDDNEIIGGITLSGERKDSKYNQVIVNYIDPDKAFSNQQVVKRITGDLTVDEEEELSGEFTFHTVTNPAIARDLAEMIYNKSRSQRQISFTGTQELLNVEVGDVIRISDTILDLDTQTFRVVSMKLKPDGTIGIEAVEHDATVYPFTKGAQIELDAPVFIPDDYFIEPFVRPLPPEPTGVTPPLDPDISSAGDLVEVNAPPDSPDALITVNGVTKFENFDIAYDTFKIRPVNRLPNDKVYHFGNTVSPLFAFGFEADGTTAIARYNNPDFATYDYYRESPAGEPNRDDGMARRIQATRSVWDGARYQKVQFEGYQFDFLMPLYTKADLMIFRAYSGGKKVFEQIEECRSNTFNPSATYPFNGRRVRFDPYTGLNVRYPVQLNYKTTADDWTWEFKWANKATGEEWEDASTTYDYAGTGDSYSWRDANGIAVRKSNVEALLNYVFDYWHESVKIAALNELFKTKSVNLGG